MKEQTEKIDLNSGNFLKGGSMASVMAVMASGKDVLQLPIARPGSFHQCGASRRIQGHWMRISWSRHRGHTGGAPNAPVVALCDVVDLPSTNRSLGTRCQAVCQLDLLADENVEAVVIPSSHQHKEIVQDALKAGKHVYCGRHDQHHRRCKAVAVAAHQHPKQYFQAGLSSAAIRSVISSWIMFARSLGTDGFSRSQWHKKTSWKRAAPTPSAKKSTETRQKPFYRIDRRNRYPSTDAKSWFLGKRPQAITGIGSTVLWKDGRSEPDTVQINLEYGGGIHGIRHHLV